MSSEQTKRLVVDLSQKVTDNTENITILNSLLPEIQTKVENFGPACAGVDSTIIPIIASINALKAQILSIGTTAQNIVGCGTTSISSVYHDAEYLYSWNSSTSNYQGSDPYGSITSQSLSSSNIGVGTFNQLSPDGGTNIGSYYSLTGPGYETSPGGIAYIDMLPTPLVETATDIANCNACKAAIVALNTQISNLRAAVAGPTNTANSLKNERLEYEIKRYGYNTSIKNLQDENTRVGISLTTLTSPAYDAIV